MSNRFETLAPTGDHTAFCAGIRSVYQILVQAGFISADEIVWPEQQTIEQHDLLRSGPLAPEMLSLVKQLPLPSPIVHEELLRIHSDRLNNFMGLMIAPSSGAVCYLYKDELTDCRNAFEAGLAESELTETAFKITNYGNQEGSMWLYDLATSMHASIYHLKAVLILVQRRSPNNHITTVQISHCKDLRTRYSPLGFPT